MLTPALRNLTLGTLWLAIALLPACAKKEQEVSLSEMWNGKPKTAEPKGEKAAAFDPLVSDTVGELTLIADNFGQRLRGFGVVVGLGENGGGDVPTTVRQYLIDYMNKQQLSANRSKPRISIEKLLDSPDTAVVSVFGVLPAGAPKGTPFDLQVEAISSQTKSLEGGLLLPCEMKVFQAAASGAGLVAGHELARAQGPIFVNPFKGEDSGAARRDQRRGLVLGGGRSTEPRKFRFILREPTYSQADRIEKRLNEQYGQTPKIADAISRGFITITTPPAFYDAPDHFMQLAPHVLLNSDPSFVDRRMRELNETLPKTADRRDALALAWEAIGKAAIPQVQVHYNSSEPALRYFAARAGLRLKDSTALPVIMQVAATRNEPYRLQAIAELGRSSFVQATATLERLLDDEDQQVRISAYEALKGKANGAIVSRRFALPADTSQLNCTIDVVRTNGKPFVYVSRTREPRIALFGENTPINLPLFYQHPQGWVTINASQSERQVSVFSRTRIGGRLSEKLTLAPRLIDLLTALADLPEKNDTGKYRGLAQPYSVIVQVLDELSHSDGITAPVVIERRSLTDLLGPTELPERPEGDIPEDETGLPPPAKPGTSTAPAQRPE